MAVTGIVRLLVTGEAALSPPSRRRKQGQNRDRGREMVGLAAQFGQHLPLFLYGFTKAQVSKGMAAPGFIIGFKKEDLVVDAVAVQFLQRLKQVIKEFSAAQIADQGHFIQAAFQLGTQLGKFRKQGGREVIHAKVAQIFKTVDGMALTCSRHAGEARSSASRLPKCCSNALLRFGPMPGMRSRTEMLPLRCRRRR